MRNLAISTLEKGNQPGLYTHSCTPDKDISVFGFDKSDPCHIVSPGIRIKSTCIQYICYICAEDSASAVDVIFSDNDVKKMVN